MDGHDPLPCAISRALAYLEKEEIVRLDGRGTLLPN